LERKQGTTDKGEAAGGSSALRRQNLKNPAGEYLDAEHLLKRVGKGLHTYQQILHTCNLY
jgi:hypothetical protein